MRRLSLPALLLIAAAPLASASEMTFRGETVVRSIDAKRVAVFLDTDGDHLVDNGFLLTADFPIRNGIAVHFPSADLVFTDGYVRVVGDKQVFDLQVAGYPDPPAAPPECKLVTLIGSALTHSAGDSGCDIQRAHEKDAGACFAYGTN
jgi:hypothetical protein